MHDKLGKTPKDYEKLKLPNYKIRKKIKEPLTAIVKYPFKK